MKTLFVVMMLVPSLAAAETIELQRGAVMEGKNEISTQVGFQASMGGSTPSGAKLFFDYSRHLKNIVWFNVKLNPAFAAEGRRFCVDRLGNTYDCGYGIDGNGYSVDALVGIKLKWRLQRFKLVPFANLNVGVVGIYNRPLGDDGAAAVFRTGGGLRWFVTPHVALGGEMDVTLGGGFYSETCAGCNNAHNELYRAFDMSLGAEFVL